MFDNVIGHNSSKDILKNDIELNRLSHAYAFVGPVGIGKKKLAEEFAKKLLNVSNLNACVDYKYISKLDGKKNILIDQIRKEIVDDVYISPATGEHKVYIIDNAETLNDESQNAILKTLEEPPEYVCIILITENIQSFLPTVVSRVKQVNFSRLTDKEINDYCIYNSYEINFDSDMLKYIDGSIGKLKLLLNEEKYNLFKQTERIVELIKSKKVLEIIREMEKISLKNTEILDYLQYLLYYNRLYSQVFEVEDARKKIKYNGNEDVIKTVMIINMCDRI